MRRSKRHRPQANNHGQQKRPASEADGPSPAAESFIPKAETPHANERAKASQKKPTPAPKDPDQIIAVWTRIVGFFTFVLALIGVFQVLAFIGSERADIAPIATAMAYPVRDRSNIEAKLTFKNGGKSTAIVTDVATVPWVRPTLPSVPSYKGAHHFSAIVSPDQTFGTFAYVVNSKDQRVFWRPDGIAALQDGRLGLWVYGYVTYRDPYSWLLGARRVGYCMHYLQLNEVEEAAADGNSTFEPCANRAYTYVDRVWPG